MDKEILYRYFERSASPDEIEKIRIWVEVSPENKTEFFRERKFFDAAVLLATENKIIREEQPNHSRSHLFVREFLKIAAVVALTISLTLFFLNKHNAKGNRTEMHTVNVPAGQRVNLMLSDGTEVWLNAKTTFTFPNWFESNRREVRLNGEAYFKVKHDAEVPFSIATEKYKVNVLGTEFNLRAYDQSALFETSLIRGSVEITDYSGKQKIILTPSMKAFLDNGSLKTDPIVNYNYFLWKDGIICFDDESVGEIIKKLELYYDVKFVVRNQSLLNYKYSGKFRTKDGVIQVLKVLQLKHRFTYDKNEELNLITIN